MRGSVCVCVCVCVQISSRWDAEAEREVLGWFKQLINKDIPTGIHKVEKTLRNGQDLVL